MQQEVEGAYGVYPHSSIDPISIAVHIYLALEALIALEADPGKNVPFTLRVDGYAY